MVTWAHGGGAGLSNYIVTASPLNFTDPLTDPFSTNTGTGFLMDLGEGNNTILDPGGQTAGGGGSGGGIVIRPHAGHDPHLNGRGSAPIAIRKIPVGAWVEVTAEQSLMISRSTAFSLSWTT
jgi:hypothetical protein